MIRPVDVIPSLQPRNADGVSYFTIPATPDMKIFRCDEHCASLTQTGCGARWREAQDASSCIADRLHGCRICHIGAAHAGAQHIHYSNLYDAAICPRYRRGAMRIIHNRQCVNCYNRTREMRAGKNGRGDTPIVLMRRPLHQVKVKCRIDGRAREVTFKEAIDSVEGIMQVLRTTRGAVVFGFAGDGAVIATEQREAA